MDAKVQAGGEFRLPRNVLVRGLATVASAVPARPNLPILGGVVIEQGRSEREVVLRTMDYALWMRLALAVPRAVGRLVVSHAELTKVVAALGSEADAEAEVTIAGAELKPMVFVGRRRARVPGYRCDDYPSMVGQSRTVATASAPELAQAVARVAPAASTEQVLRSLCGVGVELLEGGLRCVATDAYRVAEQTVAGSVCAATVARGEYSGQKTPLVSASALEAVAAAMEGDEVVVGMDPRQVSLRSGGLTVVMRRIDAQLPDYAAVPDAEGDAMEVDAAKLIEAVGRAQAIDKAWGCEGSGPVQLRFGKDGVAVVPVHVQGRMLTRVPVVSGRGKSTVGELAVDPARLLAGLRGFDGRSVVLHTETAARPILLREGDGSGGATGFRYLVMPSRLDPVRRGLDEQVGGNPLVGDIVFKLKPLLKALEAVSGAVDSKRRAGAVAGVRLVAEDDGTVTASAGSRSGTMSVTVAEAAGSGAVVVNHAQLTGLLKGAVKGLRGRARSDAPVRVFAHHELTPVVEVSGYVLPVRGCRLEGSSSGVVDGDAVAEVWWSDLRRAVECVRRAAAKDRRNPEAFGVRIEVTRGRVTMVGTNRRRLGLAEMHATNTRAIGEFNAIVPPSMLTTFVEAGAGRRVTLARVGDGDELAVAFTCGALTMSAISLRQPLLSFRQGWPPPTCGSVVVKRAELLGATERARKLVRANADVPDDVDLMVSATGLSVLPGVNTADLPHLDEVSGSVVGEPAGWKARYQAGWLRDALESLDDEEVRLDIPDGVKPLVLTGGNVEEDGFLAVQVVMQSEWQPEGAGVDHRAGRGES